MALGELKYFLSLDLASEYWQNELDEDAWKKSGYTTYHGLFKFVRMPLSLWNAPPYFKGSCKRNSLDWNMNAASCTWTIASDTFTDYIDVFVPPTFAWSPRNVSWSKTRYIPVTYSVSTGCWTRSRKDREDSRLPSAYQCDRVEAVPGTSILLQTLVH